MSNKILIGQVVGKTQKTISVEIEAVRKHPKYHKQLKNRCRILAHDENQRAQTGNIVKIVETRPISKRKAWNLAEIIK